MANTPGLSDEGFCRKRLDVLLTELNAEMQSIFGENFNVSPESPDGQINGVISESNANLWELAEQSYNASNPAAATGVSLDYLADLNGITRLAATPSRVLMTMTGVQGTLIPAGSLVSTTDTGDTFTTENDITIPVSLTAEVFANSVQDGPIIGLAGTITAIDTPISGWTSATNNSDAQLGTLEETDAELRARRSRSVANQSQAIIDAIFSAVANIDGVTQTTVLENDTNVTNVDGLPPHSFQVVVVGGVDQDIGQAIWENKPAGITSFGNTSTTVQDIQGIDHTIDFSRPTTIDIYVEVTLDRFSDYPADGDAQIKQAIVDYANGDLVQGRDFGLGDDVIYTRLYTPINSVQGHQITSLFIDITPSPAATSNIAIAATEVSNFLTVNITVL